MFAASFIDAISSENTRMDVRARDERVERDERRS